MINFIKNVIFEIKYFFARKHYSFDFGDEYYDYILVFKVVSGKMYVIGNFCSKKEGP